MQKYTETFVQNKTPLVYTPQGIVAPVIFTTSPSYYINQLIFINYTYFQDCCSQHNMSDFFHIGELFEWYGKNCLLLR